MRKGLEPMTTYRFLAELDGLRPEDWQHVEVACRRTLERFEEWDSAWNLVVALHLDGEAHPAMAIARSAGATPRVQALAGAACAAVAARGQLGERRFRALYAPFAEVLPVEEPEPARPPGLFYAWLAMACPFKAAWR
jgi:hypothetical protein